MPTLMPTVIPHWHLPMPEHVLHQYELMLHDASHSDIAYLTKFKHECLRQEYYTYLAQLYKLEQVYGVYLPLPAIYA